MEQFLLTVGNREYRVCLPTQQAAELEKQLNMSLMDAIGESAKIRVQQVFLWAGLQKYQHGITQADVLGIMDDMADGFTMDGMEFADFTIENRIKLCMKIGAISGFFNTDTKAELLAKVAKPAKATTEETEE